MIFIDINVAKFTKMLDVQKEDALKAGKKAVASVAFKIEGDCKENISGGTRTGKIYPRGKGRVHQASAAGEYPKTDYGTLVNNITTELDLDGLSATVGSRDAAPHGFTLEFGTHETAARPWLSRTIKENDSYIKKAFEDALKKTMR